LEVTRFNKFLERESLEKQRARLGIFNEAPFPTSEETSHRVGDSDLDRGPQMIGGSSAGTSRAAFPFHGLEAPHG
jgi:hypothetical protein